MLDWVQNVPLQVVNLHFKLPEYRSNIEITYKCICPVAFKNIFGKLEASMAELILIVIILIAP